MQHTAHAALPLTSALALALCLAACGNKGDLFLEVDTEGERQLERVDEQLEVLESGAKAETGVETGAETGVDDAGNAAPGETPKPDDEKKKEGAEQGSS
ncbi:MAG: hypothetical protein CSA54_03675 [Gammaproteobacteria bacterium]|nr:MAG: hypothetical protein CSA54_03675 [Gammaproteobacteria bacterium]